MTGLFFTGTDTGVGKTVVTAAVARELRRRGHAVRVCKPVATGGSDDPRILAEAAGMDDLTAVTPWVFSEPAAPPVAARRQGVVLNLADLAGAVARLPGPVLVEGVGGLLCPLTDTETVADLAGCLGLPVVIVARRGLGTLNHTLLTVEAARRRGLALAGIVVNETEPVWTLADQTNVDELRRRLDVPILAVVPHGPPGPLPAIAAVDWWQLCRGA